VPAIVGNRTQTELHASLKSHSGPSEVTDWSIVRVLRQTPAAFGYVEGGHARGKVVITV